MIIQPGHLPAYQPPPKAILHADTVRYTSTITQSELYSTQAQKALFSKPNFSTLEDAVNESTKTSRFTQNTTKQQQARIFAANTNYRTVLTDLAYK